MDKSWIKAKLPRGGERYRKGMSEFLDFAFLRAVRGKIPCPCKKCLNCFWKTRDEVTADLLWSGFDENYDQWDAHGEEYRPIFVDEPIVEDDASDDEGDDSNDAGDDMLGLLHDALGPLGNNNCEDGDTDSSVLEEEPNEAARKFYKLLEDAEAELYPGCENFSKLSFTVKLLHIKCPTGMTNKAVDMILGLLNDAFPKDHKLPKSHYEAKKITRDLGLKYEKIDACINDCVLFRKGLAKKKKCPTCNEPRWKPDPTSANEDETPNVCRKRKKIPQKVLRYFPLKPRLQRLFMSDKTASSMRWHHDERADDGVLRHPADSEVWKSFDREFHSFASEPRNVRLGLASDGMNPFGNMHVSISHSTWPVVLIPYNFPPWMCMKRPFYILSMLISGPAAPGNDIDVYLQPLIDELLELWNLGVETYDASTKQNFLLHAMLLWTINDFPAYANLSGWSTKGRLACPVCMEETHSIQLKHGGKCSYMGHRRFLPQSHRWRGQKTSFDGKTERRRAPKELSGHDIFEKLNGFKQVKFGKKRKREDEVILPGNFKKMSAFFQLPYWSSILLRHNLDPMHIEKNVFDITFGTCMNFEKKTKDNLKARLDLMEMGIREDLHPKLVGDKYKVSDACYMISRDDKGSLCNNWKKVKVPDGYSSNISRCVNTKERKITGLKSHDCHVLLQQFLPLALTGTTLPKEVRDALIELCTFFKLLCGKTLIINDLDLLQDQIGKTLCKLEMIFPPSFFVVMMHLPIHLAMEAKIAGPVQYRWMYPIERYLHTLKSYVRNKSHPEGSIAEGYIAEECLTFCSRFLGGIETRFNRPDRNYDGYDSQPQGGLSIFSQHGRALRGSHARQLSLDEWNQARLYVLNNCDEVQSFIKEHKDELAKEGHSSEVIDVIQNEQFPNWFLKRVTVLKNEGSERVTEDIISLAESPLREVRCYKGYKVNGFRFHIKDYEQRLRSQNSGVMVKGNGLADGIDYYGVVTDIVELSYPGNRRVVLFQCIWWDVKDDKTGYKKNVYGHISVNTKRTIYKDQPFTLASESMQVFYVEQIDCVDWVFVVKAQPRDSYNMPTKETTEIEEDEESSSLEACQENETYNSLGFIFDVDDGNDVTTWRMGNGEQIVDASVLEQDEAGDDDDDDIDDEY